MRAEFCLPLMDAKGSYIHSALETPSLERYQEPLEIETAVEKDLSHQNKLRLFAEVMQRNIEI